ncbi:recombinase RecA [Candidatus Roizmanbacteria bacterium CG_4_10_14_0_2_um_filter_36_35]|uniref:Protein RecA n=4 Tax=Candidatus Roizmaniibacteriota TaxID=1752723 RepID=A0A2M7BWQ5_9BACT|nr:MAG: recombinase RecA [Candidatus Roizmanbacteria bacterium CG11_big_fil_rev_8_21_14_0_20_35_14]PIV10959.1 MAG: recombinase RecA [Candidatus Roizmanbacteria bacterium CG03_land_8_20_14_0_80_35_26]PIZ68084.1 MAG: recombinase RecA [Candidatus Roizmanbacteria bacterium CG_4_10_14_0_2_um_filter_36_35]PJC32618.1 MAG: recombinase RecA [Candidatus Roizmanbacteria bacterium CG_4_9_14_0_2_um_filter_36_12]PJC80635.1 MAG: recombinase RecA [Candidatus Roizmanbacteria bacterium CG_4_8_14_3_um_filter_36_1
MKTQDSHKKQAVSLAIDQIQKQFGRGSIMRFGQGPVVPVEVISTGIMPLNVALGVGGIPRGRIAEIFGPEAAGKTTVCLSIIAEAQKAGGTAAFIDAEHGLDPEWAKKLGVKLDDLLVSQPDTGEQALEITETLIRSGGIDLVVIDSVAALVPKSEIEGEMGDSQMGLQARLMSQALRKLTGIVSKSKTTVIFTNQIRLKIGIMFGNPETTPGGLALKFYTSIRLDVRKIETLKKNNQVYGVRIRIKVVKNKVAPPFKDAEVVVTADGIDREECLVDAALNAGLITRSGSFFKIGEKLLGQGKEEVKQVIAKNEKLREQLMKQVLNKK